MSSRDLLPRTLVVLAAAAALGACSVRPLYQNYAPSVGEKAPVVADLSSIAIKPIKQRAGQELRNQLIFLFNRGQGQPAAARYSMDLGVAVANETAAVVQIADENEPSAATITLTADYRLADATTGEIVATGKRQLTSSYDVPRQQFAAVRAARDAENRAARELAELIRLDLAQKLERLTPVVSVLPSKG